MAALSVQDFALTSAALLVTKNSASSGSGDTFANNGRVIVFAENGATSATVITFVVTQAVTGASLSVPDLTVAVAASTTRAIGPLPKATFNDGSSSVAMTYANSSTLTLAVVRY